MITGTTLIKRDVLDKPVSGNIIFTIGANVVITATENKYQWLHLTGGGWVNAGAEQQYIKWHVVPDPAAPPAANPAPHPPSASTTRPITEIKRKGRIATLLVDWQNPKWNFAPRQVGKLSAYPHTVTFNTIGDRRKGARIPLTEPVLDYLGRLNGDTIKEKILIPAAGWINVPTDPPTIERLTWAANLVVVKEIKLHFDVEYSKMMEYANIHASSCYATDLDGTFFDKDMRLIVHKFNAFTTKNTMIKLSRGRDCFTPFLTNPEVMNGDMWIRTDYLEFWPELPFSLSDGTQIIEYELYGLQTFGLRADGSPVLLRDARGFKTNWRINSPELPA
ncbi:MAG: hypothetical protein K8S20_06880 [Chloroflexi bacterium]|nr:hypothetical protein [Chloroflexota bacterium]